MGLTIVTEAYTAKRFDQYSDLAAWLRTGVSAATLNHPYHIIGQT